MPNLKEKYVQNFEESNLETALREILTISLFTSFVNSQNLVAYLIGLEINQLVKSSVILFDSKSRNFSKYVSMILFFLNLSKT